MSWEELRPRTKSTASKRKQAWPVSIAVRIVKGDARSYISFRPWLIENAPAWLKHGQLVKVLLGRNDDAGILRIVPGAPFVLSIAPRGEAGKPKALILRVTGLPIGADIATVSAQFEYADEWLDVTLPVAGASAPPAPTPTGAEAATPPPAVPPPPIAIATAPGRAVPAKVPAPVAPPAPSPAAKAAHATMKEVAEWASANGVTVTTRDPLRQLGEVNDARERQGLPRFVVNPKNMRVTDKAA